MKRNHARLLSGLCLLLSVGISLAADLRETDPSAPQVSSEPATPAKNAPLQYAYRIDAGDRVSILVYQEPDLSINGVRVKADGTIAFPLLGDMHVAGLTSQQLQDRVTQRLKDGYLKKPNVTVSIDSYRLYYIKGEVTRPGGYSFVDGLTVAKAVALAGGYTPRASESKITLVRESNPDVALESVSVNTAIRPGDVITVGESFF